MKSEIGESTSAYRRGLGIARHLLTARWLRILLSIGLLAGIAWHASIPEVLTALKSTAARWPYLVLALIVPGIGVLICAMRWQVLLRAVAVRIGLPRLFCGFLVGNFFNQFFPSTIGGDIARGWWIHRRHDDVPLGLTVVAADRVVGVAGVCLVGLAAAFAQPDLLREKLVIWPIVALLAMLGISLIAIAHPALQAVIRKFIARIQFLKPVESRLRDVLNGMTALRASPGSLGSALVLSCILQAVVVCQFTILAAALDLGMDFAALAVIVPIVSLLTILPISINGIGVREVGLAAVGAAFGLSIDGAIALAWLFLLIATLYALVGGLIYLLSQ
jgi:hypothetical protein